MRYPSQQVITTIANLKLLLSSAVVLMELVIQFLDELEDWLLRLCRTWQTIAWRIAGALSFLLVVVVAAVPV